MKYIDEFRDSRMIEAVARKIRGAVDENRIYSIMEVCGTHTMSIFRFGLRDMLPENIRLVSGPGCPVCVTPNEFLDKAIWLSRQKSMILTTFGDILRVPASYSSLERERSCGADIRVVYSTTDAVNIARNNPRKEVVFIGVGFETTAPTVAASIMIAEKKSIKNYSVLCGHKTMPAALKALAKDERMAPGAFMLPGHVSAIIGARPYKFLAARYRKRCVISGFEPLDIMESILMIVKQIRPAVEIQYKRVLTGAGNPLARKMIAKVFEPSDSKWRGLGTIKNSGLCIRRGFSSFDASSRFGIRPGRARVNKSCICADVLKGVSYPTDCRLFGGSCTPEHPVGSCMVSSEGACSAYYKYGR